MKRSMFQKILAAVIIIIGVLVMTACIALLVEKVRTDALADDYSELITNEAYHTPVMIQGIKITEQRVSCGYAVLQMFSEWKGGSLTEEQLYDEYGKVVTSTGGAFCSEMNKRFPDYTTTTHKYLKNSELLKTVYKNLALGIPVPFEWAARYGDGWTLHYSMIIGMDILANTATVANPYGYIEELGLDEFLERTSFRAYEKMPLFLKLGFAFGIFEKNTVFTVE